MIVPTWPTPDTGLETCFLTVRQPGAVLLRLQFPPLSG